MLKKECFRVTTSQISLRGAWAAFHFPFTCHYFLNLLCSSMACRKWHWCEAGLFSWGMRVFAADSGHPAPSPSLLAPGPHHQVLLQLSSPLWQTSGTVLWLWPTAWQADTALQALILGELGNGLVPSTCEMWRNMPLTPKGLRVLQPFFPFKDERSFWKTAKIP